jgi:hypothetical protein
MGLRGLGSWAVGTPLSFSRDQSAAGTARGAAFWHGAEESCPASTPPQMPSGVIGPLAAPE